MIPIIGIKLRLVPEYVLFSANYLFKFAGISEKECRCENDILIYTPVNDTYCNNTCIGNYKCGGEKAYTFYNTEGTLAEFKLPKIPMNEKINIIHNLHNDAQHVFVGCIEDSPYCNQRIFKKGPQLLED